MDKIFVVEDERKLCMELMAVLEKNGYNCVSSENYEHMAKDLSIKIADQTNFYIK